MNIFVLTHITQSITLFFGNAVQIKDKIFLEIWNIRSDAIHILLCDESAYKITYSKKYCANPEHILYIDKTVDYPTLQEAIDAIKEADGLVFLPHLFIYKWADNIEELIDDILENYEIDGIECYHSEFTEDNIEYLKNICKERKYLMSGGSDYHGINKKNIELAVGKGNLKIDKEIIQNWI